MNACVVFIFVLTSLAGVRPVPIPVSEPQEENKNDSPGESNALNLSPSGICPGPTQGPPSCPWRVCMVLWDSCACYSTDPSSPKFDVGWSSKGSLCKRQAGAQCRAWFFSCGTTSTSTHMVTLDCSCTCIILAGKCGDGHPQMFALCSNFTSPWFLCPNATAGSNSSLSVQQQCPETELGCRQMWCCWYLEYEPGTCFENGAWEFPGEKLPFGACDSHSVKHGEQCEGRTWLAVKGHSCEGVWTCCCAVLPQNWTGKDHPALSQCHVSLLGQEAITIQKGVAQGETARQRARDEKQIASGGSQGQGKEERPPERGMQTFGPANWYGGFFIGTQPHAHRAPRMVRPSSLYGGFFSSIRLRGRQTKRMLRPSSLYGGFLRSTWPRGYLKNRMLKLLAVVDIVAKKTAQALHLAADQQTQLRVAIQRVAQDFLAAEERRVCEKQSWTDCCLGIDERREIVQELAEQLEKVVDELVRAKKAPYFDRLTTHLDCFKRRLFIFCLAMQALCHLAWLVAYIVVMRQKTTKRATNKVTNRQVQSHSILIPNSEPEDGRPQPPAAQLDGCPLHTAIVLGAFVVSPAQAVGNFHYVRRRRWTF